MITSDSHRGLQAALKSTFNGFCLGLLPRAHWQRNATAYVPKVLIRSTAARDISNILSAPSRVKGRRLLDLTVDEYRSKEPRLASRM